jgi:hypothetical protein
MNRNVSKILYFIKRKKTFGFVVLKLNCYDLNFQGLRNAKLMIACISNEYAQSENCMKEFRFASNLKLPIIMCTFGAANRKSDWKTTELGIISCLNNKEFNFQLENKTVYNDVLSEIKSLGIEPANKILKKVIQDNQVEINESMGTKMAYTELIELAQRKVINFFRKIYCLFLLIPDSFLKN